MDHIITYALEWKTILNQRMLFTNKKAINNAIMNLVGSWGDFVTFMIFDCFLLARMLTRMHNELIG